MNIIEQGKLFDGYGDKDFKVGKASNYGFSDRFEYDSKPSLLSQVTSSINRKQKLKKARNYVWEVGLLFRIIKMKVDFASAGFKLVHEDKKVQKIYENIYRELDMETFIRNCAFEHEVIGEWYPFFNFKNDKPIVATLLNPELIEVKTLFGNDMIQLKPSNDIRELLQSKDKDVKRRLMKYIPPKYIAKWRKGESVLLDEEMCDRYANIKAYHEKYAHSPLEPIFGDLELIKTLVEGDYSIAYKIKKAILQIKVGDKDFNEGSAVDPKLFDQAEELWSNPSQAMEVYTQWFMNAEWIIPDVDIFAPQKYEEVYRRILDWSGINVMIDDGGSFAQGYIKVKGLKQDVLNTRNEIRKALDKFNRVIAKKKGLYYYGEPKVPTVKFSDNALKDDQQIFDTVKFLYQHGILSIDDTLDAFDYDKKVQLNKKEKENKKYKDKGIVEPLFENNQGLLEDDDGGGDSPQRNSKEDSQPRPSTS